MKYVHIACICAALSMATLVRADQDNPPYAQFIATDPTIVDTATGLTWLRAVIPNQTFLEAQTSCGAVQINKVPFPMRVPTLKELLTLVDENPHDEFFDGGDVTKHIDQAAFGPETPVDQYYWSITRTVNSGTSLQAFAVDFGSGLVYPQTYTAGGGTTSYVRCVK